MIVRSAAHSHAEAFSVDDAMTIGPILDAAASPLASLVTARLDGLHSARVNRRSAKIYVLQEGGLEATVDDEVRVLAAGDTLLVEPGAVAELRGRRAVMLIITAPAFDEADEEIF